MNDKQRAASLAAFEKLTNLGEGELLRLVDQHEGRWVADAIDDALLVVRSRLSYRTESSSSVRSLRADEFDSDARTFRWSLDGSVKDISVVQVDRPAA